MPINHERWTLKVEFDSLEVQAKNESPFPYDDVNKCIALIGERWGALPEEIQEFCEWTPTTLEVTSGILDPLNLLMDSITTMMVPKRLELIRNEDR